MSDPWVEVELLTRDKQFVTKVAIPRMVPPPEVVMWGTRLFVNSPAGYVEGIMAVPLYVVQEICPRT